MMGSVAVAVIAAIDVVAWYRPKVALRAVGVSHGCIRRLAQQIDEGRVVVSAGCRSVKFSLLGLQRAADVAQLEYQVDSHACGSRRSCTGCKIAFPSRVFGTIDRIRPVAMPGWREILEFVDGLRCKSGKAASVENCPVA